VAPPPASETLTPRRGAVDCVRSADSAPKDGSDSPPPSPAKLNHHGELLLTSFGQQTQRPQRRIRFAPPPPPPAKLSHHGDLLMQMVHSIHIGTDTKQMVHSIEACYVAPVGHFHEEHEVPKRAEIQHRRYSNPRRVGKKKLFDPRSRHTPTRAKRCTQPPQLRTPHNPRGNEERRVESKIHKLPHQRRKGRRLRHRRT
jgi:hypothetical protein